MENKLTGKCLNDFEYYIYNNDKVHTKTNDYGMDVSAFYKLNETCQNALIVEFFDTQKIFINIKSKFGCKKQRERFSYNLFSFNSGFTWDSRKEALNEAIINANNFYNKNR